MNILFRVDFGDGVRDDRSDNLRLSTTTFTGQNHHRLIGYQLGSSQLVWIVSHLLEHFTTSTNAFTDHFRNSYTTRYLSSSTISLTANILNPTHCKKQSKVYVYMYSALRKAPLMRSDTDHTVLPANYTMPAFTPQPQNITALWLVLVFPSHGG